MKPPPFVYHRPQSVAEVLEIAAADSQDTVFLAGGQSLMPLLNMRLARPSAVIDLNRVEGLDGLEANGTITIGAMARQRDVETSPLIREQLPLLAEACRHIAHVAIRARGTIGGSLAHADPAAELPAVALVLGARMSVMGTDGERQIDAREFVRAPLTTSMEPGELLTGISIDKPRPRAGWSFLEVTRTHGAFALVGAAALLSTDDDGTIDFARLALFGASGVPYAPAWLDETLIGESPSGELFASVSQRVSEAITPTEDAQASGAYRRKVAGVLTKRVLAEAAQRAADGR